MDDVTGNETLALLPETPIPHGDALAGSETAVVYSLYGILSWSVTLGIALLSSKLWDYYYTEKERDVSFPFPLPPGSMGYPVVGETLNWLIEGIQYYRKRRASFGRVYKTHIFGRPTIRVCGAQNIRKVLAGEDTLVKSSWPTSTRLILGESALFFSLGVLHRKRKRAILRAFNYESLSAYVTKVQNIIRESIKSWCCQRQVLGYLECRRLTFSLAARVLLGLQVTDAEQMELLSAFYTMENNLFSLPFNLPGSGLNKGIKARHRVLSQIEKCIKQKKTEGQTDTDIFTVLMGQVEDGDEPLSDEEMKDSALEILFASHQTTASASCSILYHLLKRPDVVERIYTELRDHGLLSDADDTNTTSQLTLDAINKLDYTNRVVKEILRIMPPITGGLRTALKTFEIGGYQVPKGWMVAYGIRDTHEMSQTFGNISEFDPDRWQHTDETAQRYEYIPFGGGSRGCVGKEFAKLVLRTLVIELVQTCSWSMVKDDVSFTHFPFLRPTDGLPLRFTEVAAFRRRALTV